MKKLIYSIFISLLFSACSMVSEQQNFNKFAHHFNKAKPAIKTFSTNIPFTRSNSLIIIEIFIDNQPHSFLLDSGSPTVITQNLKKQHHFITEDEINISQNRHESIKAEILTIPSIRIGEEAFSDITALTVTTESNPLFQLLEIDGIIGSNLMRQCNWNFNFDSNIITVNSLNQPFHTYIKGFELPFSQQMAGRPFINCQLNNNLYTSLLFDIGTLGSVILPLTIEKNTFAELFTDSLIPGHAISEKNYSGNTDSIYFLSKLRSLNSGNMIVNDIPVIIEPSMPGLLGIDFISQFNTTINYSENKIYLLPANNTNLPNNYYGYGFNVTYQNGDVLIGTIWEDSPAFAAGLDKGDKILRIHDLALDNISYTDYKTLWLSNSLATSGNAIPENIELEIISKSGKTKIIKLNKEPLLPW